MYFGPKPQDINTLFKLWHYIKRLERGLDVAPFRNIYGVMHIPQGIAFPYRAERDRQVCRDKVIEAFCLSLLLTDSKGQGRVWGRPVASGCSSHAASIV